MLGYMTLVWSSLCAQCFEAPQILHQTPHQLFKLAHSKVETGTRYASYALEHSCHLWILRNPCSRFKSWRLQRCLASASFMICWITDSNPSEECFSVFVLLISRDKSTSLWIYTPGSPQIMLQSRLSAEMFCGPPRFHLHVTSSSVFVLLLHLSCDMWQLYSWFLFSAFIYISQCLQAGVRMLY